MKRGSRAATFALLALVLLGVAVLSGAGYYTTTPAFCGGSCHTMTEAYDAWKRSGHHAANNSEGRQARCVDCHFLPGEQKTLKAQLRGLRHLAAYLYDPGMPLPIRAVVKDGSCVGCHPRAALADKEIPYTKKVKFKHKAHFGDKALKGESLTCDTCHMKVSKEKHFEVPKEICFLCHFTPRGKAATGGLVKTSAGASIRRDDDPARCDMCHTIPTQSLQSQKADGEDDPKGKVITHQTLEKDGVSCDSCHFQIIHGAGTVKSGNVITRGCLTCHNAENVLLATITDGRKMHERHIKTARADCFDCHDKVEHSARDDHYDRARRRCTTCHDSEQHREQTLLLSGAPIVDGVQGIPALMHKVNTNCVGCHRSRESLKGHSVMKGSPTACADCHTNDQKKMVKDWQEAVKKEVAATREMMAEAAGAIARAGSNADPTQIGKARALFAEAERILGVVERGNGVHNKKYAVTLLDAAFTRFEDAKELFKQ